MANDISKILKGAKVYKWTREPAITEKQAADMSTFYGVTSLADVIKAVSAAPLPSRTKRLLSLVRDCRRWCSCR